MIEHPLEAQTQYVQAYLQLVGQRHLELYKLFFEHGIETLLTPLLGPDVLSRSDHYSEIAAQGLLWFAQNKDYLDFYDRYNIRVQVYGDLRRYLPPAALEPIVAAYTELAQRTAAHSAHRLFFGVCAYDATETIADISAHFYQTHGSLPTKHQIVEAYYGEYIDPLDLFIGFERFSMFDVPLITSGQEDLYFTVSPSLYLEAETLRAILYDHLYARRINEDYSKLSSEERQLLEEFYHVNRRHVLGLGLKQSNGNFWYPLPQVTLPPELSQTPAD
jgi:hypothetical protein